MLAALALALTLSADDEVLPVAQAPYDHRWAVIIGIDYANRTGDKADEIQPLKHARSDAESIAKVLVDAYGYAPEQITVLLEEKATGKAIKRALGEGGVADPDRVSGNDSVLIYFAGHGVRRSLGGENFKGFLVPYDAETLEGKGVDYSSCLSIGDLVDDLKGASPARHKLLVLDCCHSGEVFKAGQRGVADRRFDPVPLRKPAVQAVASVSADERAPDQGSLSQALVALLGDAASKGEPLRASALFADLEPKVREMTDLPIHPRGGSLTPDEGDYYFLPKGWAPGGRRPGSTAGAPAKLLAQPVIGLNGRWWFEEAPWLIPAIRARLAVPAPPPSGEPGKLEGGDTAKTYQELYRLASEAPRPDSPAFPELLRQPARLNATRLKAALEADLKVEPKDAAGWHLRAALQHRLDLPEAAASYERAIREYGAAKETAPLRALCLGDYGRYLSSVALRYEDALDPLDQAIEVARKEGFRLLQADSLALKSDAHKRVGEWRQAYEALDDAMKVAAAELEPGHPLIAYLRERIAWSRMENWDAWDVPAALESFRVARALREQSASRTDSNDDEWSRMVRGRALIAKFHDEHGLAMTERFSGHLDQCRKQYAELTRQIRAAIEGGTWPPAILEGLKERLINSYERQADTFLFAESPAAPRLYERALLENDQNGPPDLRRRYATRLGLKRAAGLALANRGAESRAELERIKADLDEPSRHDLRVYLAVAEGLSALAERTAGARERLRDAIRDLTAGQDSGSLQREDRELMLLACRVAIRSDPKSASASGIPDLLLSLLPKKPGAAVLPYLRGYLDDAVDSSLAAGASSESLIQAILRYRYAADDAYNNLDPTQPSLIFTFRADRGFALLATPERARIFPLPFGLNALKKGEPPALPEDLIAAANAEPGAVVYYEDPPAGLPAEPFPFAKALPTATKAQAQADRP
jgi:tetratricopeptide (TPR) repeat protein